MDDDFGDHGIIFRRDAVSGVERRIHAHAVAGRQMQVLYHAGAWHKVLLRDLRIDAALDGMAAQLDALLVEA